MVAVLKQKLKARPKPLTLADLAKMFGPMPTRIRRRLHFAHGVHMVVKGAQVLDRGHVVPGFKVKVARIFAILDEY